MKNKIVVIGAASIEFGGKKIAEMLISPDFNGIDLTISLVDINSERLEIVYNFLLRIKEHFTSNATIEKTMERKEALKDADFVIISIEQKRYELWEQDYRIPRSYGFRQALGENAGPGGIFHALRSFHQVVPMCQDIAEICPKAIVLNFTNPESYVCMAGSSLTNAKVYGLCHGVYNTREKISMVLDRPEEEIDIVCGGLNHFHWVTKIVDKKTGQDLYPQFKNNIDKFPIARPKLVKNMLDIFGCYTYPSDDHIGEYLSYGYEPLKDKWHYGRECIPADQSAGYAEVNDLGSIDMLAAYADGSKELDEKALDVISGEHAISIMAGLTKGTSHWEPAMILKNTGNYVENLPPDAMVEVPVLIENNRISPQSTGPISEPLAAYCRTQISVQKMTVKAYQHRSKSYLLQAVLLDPCVNSIEGAKEMIDDMLEIQKNYLPIFQ